MTIAPLLIVPALGVALGYALGGRLRALAGLRLDFPWLIWLALALQACQYVPAIRALLDGLGFRPTLPSYAVLALWLGLNALRRRGALRLAVAVITLGWSLNVAVIAANGAMPVSAAAVGNAGAEGLREGQLFKHVVARPNSDLRWLGDSIVMRPLRLVVSPGDLTLWLGVVGLVAVGMSPSAVRPSRGRVAVPIRPEPDPMSSGAAHGPPFTTEGGGDIYVEEQRNPRGVRTGEHRIAPGSDGSTR